MDQQDTVQLLIMMPLGLCPSSSILLSLQRIFQSPEGFMRRRDFVRLASATRHDFFFPVLRVNHSVGQVLRDFS